MSLTKSESARRNAATRTLQSLNAGNPGPHPQKFPSARPRPPAEQNEPNGPSNRTSEPLLHCVNVTAMQERSRKAD